MASVSRHLVIEDALRRVDQPHTDQRVREAVDEIFAALLDDVSQKVADRRLDQHSLNDAMDELILALRTGKLNSSDLEWGAFISMCRNHPLKDLLHQDPFTYRAFSKPRGYAGDAELLDFIYGREERWPPPEASLVGRRVFDYTIHAPAPEGVRARRGFVADLIDRLADGASRPHILSIGAGHLREASLAAAVRRKKIGRYLAVDRDPLSLQEIERSYSCFGVEAQAVSIRKLLTNQLDLGQFDLVYSMGLFDYVRQPTARRLVSIMFQMLRPRGRVVVSNFMPGIRDVGYMEAFMDWNLVYRTRQEMIDMTMEIPQASIRNITLFAEENQNILFLEVAKS